jgi:alkylation response protein AidB-like acyl-CoA dehydrogenase
MIPAMADSPTEAARRIAKRAAARAAESESARRLPADLSAEIAAAGLYRLCVPAALGGSESPPQTLLEVVEELARGDGAAGWCVAVCATSGMLAAYLDDEPAREVFGDPATVTGGVFAPSGTATVNGERLEVEGRWRFASNVENCGWLMGGCVVVDGQGPRTLPSGRPDVRLVLFEAADAEVIDTWSVTGLRGTGSHDMAVAGLAVPAARSASLISDRPRAGGALYAFPPFGLLAAAIAAAGLGIARAALDDLAELAGAKTPTLSTRKLAERPLTQASAAQAEAGLRAARALLGEAVDRAWEAAQGGSIPRELKVGLRLAATHTVEAAAVAVDRAQRLAGGSAIYEASPLERRFRDIHAVTQHMLVGSATWELTGRALLGLEFDDSQL